MSVPEVVLACIFPHSDWIRRETSTSPYSVWMRENADQNNFEYGHFLRIVATKVRFTLRKTFTFFEIRMKEISFWNYGLILFLSNHYVRPSDERNNFSKTNYYFSTLFCRSVTFKSLPGYLSLIQARLLGLCKKAQICLMKIWKNLGKCRVSS